MQEKTYFSKKITFLSFFCSVLVVFIHSYGITEFSVGTFAEKVETFISSDIAQVAVPLFFAMSAFLFYQNFDFSKLLDKYKKRFRSLVIPYLIWNTVYLVFFFFISRFSFINTEPFELNAENIASGIFLFKYNMVFWFMAQLILLTALCPLIYLLMKNKWTGSAAIALLLVLYAFGIHRFSVIQINSMIYYMIGAYAALNFKDAVIACKGFGWLSIPLFAASQVLFFTGAAKVPVVGVIFRVIMIFAVFFAYNFFYEGIATPPRFTCSFAIYSMHVIILETLNKVFSFFIPPDSNLILIDYFVSPVITIVLIILIAGFIKKKLPKVYGILWGGR